MTSFTFVCTALSKVPYKKCSLNGSVFFLLSNRDKATNDASEINGTAKSSISSALYPDKEVMCCANNTEGQECSQLYDFGS